MVLKKKVVEMMQWGVGVEEVGGGGVEGVGEVVEVME